VLDELDEEDDVHVVDGEFAFRDTIGDVLAD